MQTAGWVGVKAAGEEELQREAVNIETARRPQQPAVKEGAVAPHIRTGEQKQGAPVRPHGISLGRDNTKQQKRGRGRHKPPRNAH